MIFTLRKSLYDACETCLQPSVEVVTSVTNLKNISSSVSCFLEQMAGNCTSDEPEVLFIKNILVEIISRLTSLNAYLSNYENQLAKL